MKKKTTKIKTEKAVLVGIILPHQNIEQIKEYLYELEFLAETAGAYTEKVFTQNIQSPHPATFIGKGKLNEVNEYVKENKISLVIFDDELTGTQIKHLENILKCKILDRTGLILDIFAGRALTSYAKVQVELAQYQYLLPRLTRMWTHLERQKGGIGLRGPGETELETDKRVIRDKITRLKKELASIDKQMVTQRKQRGEFVRVSLVGYTNVGKSTIMNLLSKSDLLAENKLFATLDTTIRKVTFQNLPFLLSDTVGFIRKLPHSLIESFKSTLDEVRESDLLIHVVDISHPSFEEQINIVQQTLKEIAAQDKQTIIVFNKTDLIKFEENTDEEDTKILSKSWIQSTYNPCVFISATNKSNIDDLRELMYETIKNIHVARYPYNNLLY